MTAVQTTLAHRLTSPQASYTTLIMTRPSLSSVMRGDNVSLCHVAQGPNGTNLFSLVAGQSKALMGQSGGENKAEERMEEVKICENVVICN